MVYLSLGFLLLIFSFIEIFTKYRRFTKIAFFTSVTGMIFLVSFRDGMSVGIDSPAYYSFYIEKNPPVELAYKYINDFFSSMGINYNIYLLIINTLILCNISKYIKHNSYLLILPLFIYYSDFYFYYNFSGIRQAIAMSFTVLSIYYIFSGEKVKPLIFIGIAALFHISALIFCLAFILPKTKISISKYIKFLAALIIGIYAFSYIIQNNEYLNYKFLFYSSLQEQDDNILSNYYFGVFKRILVFLSILLIRKSFFRYTRNIFLFNLYLTGFFIYLVTYLVSPDFGVRFGSYFIIVDGLLIAECIRLSNSLFNKLFLFLFFALVAIYKIYTYTLISAYDYTFFTILL